MAKEKAKPKKSEIDEEQLDEVRELAAEGNTLEDIASLIGVNADTLRVNETYARAVSMGVADMRCNLRHWQMQAAQSGNVTMLVWLGKVILGQREETEQTIKLQREDDELTRSLTNLAKEMDAEHGKREAT